jgi:Tfp pilus assembly protein PilF
LDRIAQLRTFVEARPTEPFPRYALALELKGKGDVASAVVELQELLRRTPDYLAAYLQLGLLLQTLGRNGDARATLSSGQELASRKGDTHTLSELTSALETLAP